MRESKEQAKISDLLSWQKNLTLYLVKSLSNILRIGAISGAKKFANLAQRTPFRKASSSSIVGGISSPIQASIHLK